MSNLTVQKYPDGSTVLVNGHEWTVLDMFRGEDYNLYRLCRHNDRNILRWQFELDQEMTNVIHYLCACGAHWDYPYDLHIEGQTIYLDRIIESASLQQTNDGLCICGAQAEGRLETPMPGYHRAVTRLLVPVVE